MILEFSISLIMNPDDLGVFAGTITVPGDKRQELMDASSFVIKLWCILIQFTRYRDAAK